MLDFWVTQADDNLEMVEACWEDDFKRPADFQIEIEAFHLAYDNGLKKIADKVGLSFFDDALLSPDACKKIRDCLMTMDIKALTSVHANEVVGMQSFFIIAADAGKSVGVVCD